MIFTDPLTEDGRRLAATVADVLICNCNDVDSLLRLRSSVHAFAGAASRDPSTIRILLNVFAILGSTEAEAKDAALELSDRVDPQLSLALLESQLGPSPAFSAMSLEGKTLADLWPHSAATIRAVGLDAENSLVAAGRKTIGRMAGYEFVGTPEQLADRLEDIYSSGACDGFNILPARLPGDLALFGSDVMPLLRKRNLLADLSAKPTLHDRLGLAHPRSRYAAARPPAPLH